jgi:hypothetical protein
METLKRSEKFCPTCKAINPIRTFNCKKCQYSFPQKFKEPKTENKKLDDFLKNSLKSEKPKKIINPDKVEKECEYRSSNHSKLMSSLNSNMRPEDQIDSQIILEETDNEGKKLENLNLFNLKFKNFDFGRWYSSDFTKNSCTLGILGLVAYYNNFINRVILNIIRFEERKIPNVPIEAELSGKDYYFAHYAESFCPLDLDIEVCIFSVRHIENSPYFLMTINNILILYLLHEDKLYKLDEIHLGEYINKIDAIFICSPKEILKIVVSDYENKIHLFSYSQEKKLKIVSTYERFFNYKITDLKFLPRIEKIKVNDEIKIKYFFAACSKDSTLKIFDTFNYLKPAFSHKSTELWITRLYYHKRSDMLYYFVNSNLNERVVTIKFFSDKEYSIKRIAETENSIYSQIDEENNKIFLLKNDGTIKYITIPSILELHVYHRSKKNRIVSRDLHLNEGMKDTYTQFYIYEVKNSKSQSLLVLPCLDQIKLNIITY